MTNDPLAQLLTRADAAADAGIPDARAEHSPQQIRAELRRRQVRTRTILGSVAALLIAAVAIPLSRPSRPPTVHNISINVPKIETNPREIARLRSEIASLQAQASAGEATVATMLRAEQRARRAPARPAADVIARIRDQQDLAALALVRQADRLYRELDHKQSAATTYESVLALFPQTPSATTARQRLAEIKG